MTVGQNSDVVEPPEFTRVINPTWVTTTSSILNPYLSKIGLRTSLTVLCGLALTPTFLLSGSTIRKTERFSTLTSRHTISPMVWEISIACEQSVGVFVYLCLDQLQWPTIVSF